jgi:hypothetical protein
MWFACIHPGGVALVQEELACVCRGSLHVCAGGACMCVQGELFVVFEIWFGGFSLCLSMVLSRLCRVVALA